MRIALLVDCYYPSPKSSAKHMHDLAVELRRIGHDIIVVTPSPSVCNAMQISEEDGVRVVRIRMASIKDVAKVFRAMREARLSATFWRAGRKFFFDNPCDLIIFYSPTIFFGELVHKLKQMWRCPAYLILRDIFPQWAVEAGILRKGMVYRFFRRKELLQYSAADVIAVQTRGDLEYFRREFPQHTYRLEVLYNWTTLDTPPNGRRYRQELGLEGKVVFFFGGNMGVAQDMDNLLRLAAGLAPRRDIHLLLIGEGSEVPRLQAAIQAQRLENITLMPPVGHEEYLRILAEFDVGLVTLDRRLTTHNVPGKLLGYVQCGLPVLASVNPGSDLFGLIQETGAGICCANGDDDALRSAALNLADHAEFRRKLGGNARRLLEQKFSVHGCARQIFEHLRKHTSASEPAEAVSAR